MEAATDSKQKPSSPVIKLAQLQEAMEHGLISEAEFLEARQLVDPEHVKAEIQSDTEKEPENLQKCENSASASTGTDIA